MTIDDPFLVLTTQPPVFSTVEASAVLSTCFDRSGELRRIASERDLNFLVTGPDKEKYVLKIANSAEPASVTAYQTAALAHIANVAPDLPVPRIIPSAVGRAMEEVVASDGRRHAARLLTWLEGTPVDSNDRQPHVAALLGTSLAGIDRALHGFEHPASGYVLLWDLKNASSLKPLLDCIDDVGLRSLCSRRLERFQSRVWPAFAGLHWQTIHNDLNPGNILIDRHNGNVTAIIDFGDIVYSPLIVDVAVASAYLLSDTGDPLADVLKFVKAYSAVQVLSDAEIDVLFDLMLTRLAMTILISRWRAEQYPENRDYILCSESAARKMLGKMDLVSAAESTKRLRYANNNDRHAGENT